MNAIATLGRELTYMKFDTASYYDAAYNRSQREISRIQKKRAREMEVKKHIIQLVFAVFFVFIVLLFVNHTVSKASAGEDILYFKYYTTIEVKPADTLTSIANQYSDDMHYDSVMEYIDEVLFINHLDDADQIKAGTFLTVPYYSTEYK